MDVVTVNHILASLERLAPSELALDYDNVGLLVGSKETQVTGIMTGLELTDELIDDAIIRGCNVIVVHHPLIFKPLYSVKEDQFQGKKIISLIRKNISLIAAHTNLDMAVDGLNDYMVRRLSLEPVESLSKNIRLGTIESQTLLQFVKHIKETLNLDYIHYCGNEERIVQKIALCTGSGMSFYQEACNEGVDVYITGDMKYHDATYAIEMNTPVIDATHFGTEVEVENLLRDYLTLELASFYSATIPVYTHGKYKNPIKVL